MAKSFSLDIPVKVPGKRIWWAVIKDAHNFLPKCMPDVVASVEYEGSPTVEVGKVRTIKFCQGSRYVKGIFEEVEDEELRVKIGILEGGFTGVLFKRYKYIYKFEEEVIRWCVEYEALSTFDNEEASQEGAKQETVGIIRAVENYLLTHNDYA